MRLWAKYRRGRLSGLMCVRGGWHHDYNYHDHRHHYLHNHHQHKLYSKTKYRRAGLSRFDVRVAGGRMVVDNLATNNKVLGTRQQGIADAAICWASANEKIKNRKAVQTLHKLRKVLDNHQQYNTLLQKCNLTHIYMYKNSKRRVENYNFLVPAICINPPKK